MLPTRYPQPVLLHHLWWRQLWETLQLRCLVAIDLLWPHSSHFAYYMSILNCVCPLVVSTPPFFSWTMLSLHIFIHCTSSHNDVACQVPTTEAAAPMADAPMVADALDKDCGYRCSDLTWERERACMVISGCSWILSWSNLAHWYLQLDSWCTCSASAFVQSIAGPSHH